MRNFELANGEPFDHEVDNALVSWHLRPADAEVRQSDITPLLGTAQIRFSRDFLHALDDREITLDEIVPVD